MKTVLTHSSLLCIAALLLVLAPATRAQNIYKCTQGGQISYTDRPCPPGKGELIHQADDSEIIDQYLRLGQNELARRYAESHHLDTLYQQRLAAHQQALEERAQRQADEARQRDEQARQQALADEIANRDRLSAENDALRQQNEDYRDQLAQPVYNDPPLYWGGVAPPRWNRPHGDRHPHRPPPAKEPAYHPCKQLAGGRVQC